MLAVFPYQYSTDWHQPVNVVMLQISYSLACHHMLRRWIGHILCNCKCLSQACCCAVCVGLCCRAASQFDELECSASRHLLIHGRLETVTGGHCAHRGIPYGCS
jgi:hypothetical protein